MSVRLVPAGTEIAFHKEDGLVSFTVEELKGHGMVELALGIPG